MTRSLIAAAVLAALALPAGSAVAAPATWPVEHNVPVILPPGPCVKAGGRVDRVHGHPQCIAAVVVFEPPDPCLRDHGLIVSVAGGRRGCALRALRDPQSGLPTGKRIH